MSNPNVVRRKRMAPPAASSPVKEEVNVGLMSEDFVDLEGDTPLKEEVTNEVSEESEVLDKLVPEASSVSEDAASSVEEGVKSSGLGGTGLREASLVELLDEIIRRNSEGETILNEIIDSCHNIKNYIS